MAWVIWHNNDEKGRREYVRRITPNFVSYTVEFRDARRFDSKAAARAALAGTGLVVGRVRRENGADVEPAEPRIDVEKMQRDHAALGDAERAAADARAAVNDPPPLT